MIGWLNRNLFGPALPLALIIAGAYFLIICRAFWIRHPISTAHSMLKRGGETGSPSPFRAVTVALAGTLGVGNIAGVATAITAGGSGAVFWMWVSAFFAMGIKYAEIVLAQLCRERKGSGYVGGAAYYIKRAVGSRGLASVFSVLCLASSFTIGNIVQSNATADAMRECFSIPPAITGCVVAVAVCVIVLGGIRRVGSFSSAVIPILSVVYIVMSAWIIVTNASDIPRILGDIMHSALDFKSALGGAAGYGVYASIRYGAARGVMSNEAGCGTAPTVHAQADARSPAEQGIWGVFEVFADTIVLCTVTALVILLAFGRVSGDGTALAVRSYTLYLGRFAEVVMCVSVLLYALASIICWSYYGISSLEFLGLGERARRTYVLLYGLACVWGAVAAPGIVWELADLSISAMTVLNVCCVASCGGEIRRATRKYLDTL